MSRFVGAGWSVRWGQHGPAEALYIGRVPYRRSVAVYIVKGSVSEVVAYCRSEKAARSLIETLERLI